MGFRCEDLIEGDAESRTMVKGTVANVDRLGDSAVVYFEELDRPTRMQEIDNSQHTGFSQRELNETKQSEPLVARFAAATELVPGDVLELSVQPSRVMWFDLHSGENLLKE